MPHKKNNNIFFENKLKFLFWGFIGLVFFVVLFARIRLLNIPMERDEAEYGYMGQLMLQGIPPYEMAYNMKFPGTHLMYAFFMSIFGQTLFGIHMGLLIVNLCASLFIFLFVRKFLNNNSAAVAAAVYALLTISNSVYGFAAHATHYLVLFAIAGTFYLYKTINNDKKIWFFLSGILLGIVPIMKQQGIFFCVFGAVFLLLNFLIYRKIKFKPFLYRYLIFALGGFLPFFLMLLILKIGGVFDKFWFWTFEYAKEYENQVSLNDAFPLFKRMILFVISDLYFVWIIAALGLIIIVFHPLIKKKSNLLFILLFTVFSFLSVCPGLYFRPHYFIVFLPAVAILFSIFTDFITTLKIKHQINYLIFYLILIFPITFGIYSQKDYLFKNEPNYILRKTYGFANTFIESIKIADYIKKNSKKNDKVAIIGSEPQIFFYSGRHSATGYIFTFSLNENQKNKYIMQKEMIQEIETAHPKFIVCFPDSIYYISQWINPYLQQNKYKENGIVEMFPGLTIYKWGDEAVGYKPRSEVYAIIYKR